MLRRVDSNNETDELLVHTQPRLAVDIRSHPGARLSAATGMGTQSPRAFGGARTPTKSMIRPQCRQRRRHGTRLIETSTHDSGCARSEFGAATPHGTGS